MQEIKKNYRNWCKVILFYPNLQEINQGHQEFPRQVSAKPQFMQDSKFLNFFSKNPSKIAFFILFFLYVLNFSSHKNEHN